MSKIKVILIGVAFLLLLIGVKFLFLMPENTETGPGKSGQKPVTTVTGFVVKHEQLENDLYATGTLLANEEVELRTEVSGKITFLNVREGAMVSKGELLVKINDADLQAQLSKLQWQLGLAEEKEVRSKKILTIKGISQEEYDVVLAQVNVLKSERAMLEAQIAKTEIRAPFPGLLGVRNISEGAYITSNTLISTLQQLDQIKIDFFVPEKYRAKLKTGDNLSFSVQGVEGQFTARVYVINPKIDPITRTVQIRAIVSNAGRKLYPGAFAKVRLPLEKNNKALMVPTESVIPVLKGQKVFVYQNGIAQEKKIEVGARNATTVEVINGLTVGDTIVVTGVLSVRQGAPLKLSKIN